MPELASPLKLRLFLGRKKNQRLTALPGVVMPPLGVLFILTIQIL
jgi:hypothetical protein